MVDIRALSEESEAEVRAAIPEAKHIDLELEDLLATQEAVTPARTSA